MLLDVDGTLVDSNYAHVEAWQQAFTEVDCVVPAWRIHRSIGMDGDQLVESLLGQEQAARLGEKATARHDELFGAQLDAVRPLAGAHRLLAVLRERELAVVLASSGKPSEIEHYIQLLDADELVDAWTTADDVDQSKPQPDLLEVATARVGVPPKAMIGDSVWDCRAAARLGIPSIGLLSGGVSAGELEGAGAAEIRSSPEDLAESLPRVFG